MSYRLTVHIDNAPDIISEVSKKKTGIKNTISIRNIKSKDDVERELNIIKSKHKISVGKNGQKRSKYGKELIYVSYEK